MPLSSPHGLVESTAGMGATAASEYILTWHIYPCSVRALEMLGKAGLLEELMLPHGATPGSCSLCLHGKQAFLVDVFTAYVRISKYQISTYLLGAPPAITTQFLAGLDCYHHKQYCNNIPFSWWL